MTSSSDQALSHHPYWLEVHEVTPVSASVLWTLRPPPISAIPLNLLRQKQLSNQYKQQSPNLKNASARGLAAEVGVTATRSFNRRVTRVTMRNISPNKQSRFAKHQQQQQSQNQSAQRPTPSHTPLDYDDWPSDDGATAVDDDEARDDDDGEMDRRNPEDFAGGVEDAEDGDTPAKIFDSSVSVYINGVPWSQVMIGDRSATEAFIVIYGLSPSRDYELVLSVEGRYDGRARISTSREEAEIGDKALATILANERVENGKPVISPSQTPARARAHTPPMQDTDATNNNPEPQFEQTSIINAANSAAVSSVLTGVINASTLQASIRKARKDASRAESALKNEIEAIRRGLERMSDVDHRSKQKVLALQESIRQANLHAKEIDEEAVEVEASREEWEGKEREKDVELREVKKMVEESIKEGDLKIKQDEDDIEHVSKELQKVTKVLEEQYATKEKLEKETIAEVEQELTRVQLEIENLLQPVQYPQTHPYQQYGHSPLPNYQQIASPAFYSPQALANARQRNIQQGGYRNVSSPANINTYPRKIQSNRSRMHVHPRNHEDAFYDFQTGSSSSIQGSSLNPHNPEFIPASANSSISHAKSAQPSQTDYSPSVFSRSTFLPTSFQGIDQESERNTSLASMGLSPRSNAIGSNALNLPWSVNTSSTHPNSNMSLWSNSTMSPSPTLGNDIWGAPSANLSSINATSTTSPLSLRQKTSLPFDLNISSLRHNNQAGKSSISNAAAQNVSEQFVFAHFDPLRNETDPDRRRESAPVSPDVDSTGT